jgi:hypothetical protein
VPELPPNNNETVIVATADKFPNMPIAETLGFIPTVEPPYKIVKVVEIGVPVLEV